MNNPKHCLFCDKPNQFVQSHIIPDFLFRDVKGPGGDILTVNLDLTPSKKVKKNFFTDENFLCTICESRVFSKWEGFAARFLNKDIYPIFSTVERQFGAKDLHEQRLTGINYKQLKLFLLSILWRAHHSNQEMYSRVDLGDDEPRIKAMLLNEDPGEQDEFEMAVIAFIDVTGSPFPVIIEPGVIEGNTLRFCQFVMGGMAYIINLPGGSFKHFERYSLKSTGELLLPLLSGLQGYKMLRVLHVPDDMAKYFSFRIMDKKGDIISMAKNDHFDVLLNLCPCNEKRNGLEMEIPKAFGIEPPGIKAANKSNLGKMHIATLPVKYKLRKELHIVDAYVRLDNRNTRPFDTNAFLEILRAANEKFKGLTIAMPKIWNGFVSWDIDGDKVLTILDRELTNCRVHTITATEPE